MTPAPARAYVRDDAILTILGGYLACGSILTAALMVMQLVEAIQSLRSAFPAAW